MSRILIVDDCEDILDVLFQYMTMNGHQVMTASDGYAGYTTAMSFRPHVCFIDFNLKRLSGFGLAAKLRPMFDKSVLIAHTGYTDLVSVGMAIKSGFDFHALKPLDLDTYDDLLSAKRQPCMQILNKTLRERSATLLAEAEELRRGLTVRHKPLGPVPVNRLYRRASAGSGRSSRP